MLVMCNNLSLDNPYRIEADLKETREEASEHWASLMTVLLPGFFVSEKEMVLEDLLTRYNEPHRAYHNLKHVVSMLNELNKLSSVPDRSLVALAIWFHDAIYDPMAKDNEEASAQLAEEKIVEIGLPSWVGNKVFDLIIATKHETRPTDLATQILVDLDLMGLGKSREEFEANGERIRVEYKSVTEAAFRLARAKIFQAFLNRPSIYSTVLFRDKYESSARANLKRAIDKLRQ